MFLGQRRDSLDLRRGAKLNFIARHGRAAGESRDGGVDLELLEDGGQ
jgi:hypothetical protein